MSTSLLRTNKDIVDIYERHVDTVYRVCFMYMKNKSDTEDMVQSTFIKLMQYQGDFENIEHEKAWLIVTSSNLCKNFFRHWWRKNIDMNQVEEPVREEHKLDETLEFVFKLPDKYKVIIYLYYYEGYTTKEISRTMNMNESTVRSHLHKGRKLLKDIIGSEEL